MPLIRSPRGLRTEEYFLLAEHGAFQDQSVELIEGEIYTMAPEGPEHATALTVLLHWLYEICPPGHFVRQPAPLTTSRSAPEPDIAVIQGSPRDYRAGHPTTAALVVEIAQSSLSWDRKVKVPLYASMGIPEYWILDLNRGITEVYRDPVPTEADGATVTFHYRSVFEVQPTDLLTPLFAPGDGRLLSELLF
jgi:Uma2 family endonuclease